MKIAMKRVKQLCCILAMVIVFSLSAAVSFAEDENATVSFIKGQIHSECDYHIELIAENGTKYTPTEREKNNKTYYDFTVPVKKADEYYTYKFVPDVTNADDYYGSQGKLWVYQDVTLAGYNLSDGGYYTVSKKKDVLIDVPEGSIPRYCLRPLFYRYIDKIDGEKVSTSDGFDTYKLEVPEVPNATVSYYEVTAQDKVTWAGFLSNMEKISDDHYKLTDTLKSDPSQITHNNQSFYEAGLLLNGPGSKFIELKSGEYFDIYAHRVWQAINSTTGNAYVDPTFHYEVIDGEDSISVDDEGRITAKAEGTGIVEVTYDALDYVSADTGMRQLYSACWPERAGVYVINVDGAASTDIEPNINLDEFSTVYYATTIDGVDTGISSAQKQLKDGYISGNVFGINAHNEMRKGGFVDNHYVDDMDNPSIDMGKQCVLPEFSINVEAQGAAEERAKREAGELKSLTIGYNTSYNNLLKLDEDLSWTQNYVKQLGTASLVYQKPVNINIEAKDPDSIITVFYSNTSGLSGSKVVNSGENTVLTTAEESLLAAAC